jgi:hypothetical protein
MCLRQAYLEHLTSAGRWGDAAAMLPRLLKDSGAAWERWLFTFAQVRTGFKIYAVLGLLYGACVLPLRRLYLHCIPQHKWTRLPQLTL